MRNKNNSYESLLMEQNKRIRKIVQYSYNHIKYYNSLFKQLKIEPEKIKTIKDLEKIPVLQKEDIIKNWNDFIPNNISKIKYFKSTTGGSTGAPLKFRIEKKDRTLGIGMLYRGWSYASYELGEKMIFLGGASLDYSSKNNFLTKIQENVRNIKKFSSFDMGESDLKNNVQVIRSFKPKYLRGYASSIYFFSEWIEENDIKLPKMKAVFTTSDQLYPAMRKKIENVFSCPVYDGYGLNDGGVTAFECNEHNGLHIDTERSVMEIVDSNLNQLEEGEGTILATSLHNYAMPFIRYNTEDVGFLLNFNCNCGKKYKLLKELRGRVVDTFYTPEGKNVNGWFFIYIIWESCKGIKKYQIIQENLNKIIINIVVDNSFDYKQLNFIEQKIKEKSKKWEIEFKILDKINLTESGKYKYIINKLNKKNVLN
jgi:phenylacetate-CoA ligase